MAVLNNYPTIWLSIALWNADLFKIILLSPQTPQKVHSARRKINVFVAEICLKFHKEIIPLVAEVNSTNLGLKRIRFLGNCPPPIAIKQ